MFNRRWSMTLGIIGLIFVLIDLFVLQTKMILMLWISPVAWVIPIFRNMSFEWQLWITYLTTPIVYFLIGVYLDRTLTRRQKKQTT